MLTTGPDHPILNPTTTLLAVAGIVLAMIACAAVMIGKRLRQIGDAYRATPEEAPDDDLYAILAAAAEGSDTQDLAALSVALVEAQLEIRALTTSLAEANRRLREQSGPRHRANTRRPRPSMFPQRNGEAS